MPRVEKIPVCCPPEREPVAPSFILPANTTDCHAHVFDSDGPSNLDPQRSYSPSEALSSQYIHLHKTLGIDRGVIVQPSVYGTDNRTTLDYVARHPGKLRAVVVVDETVSPETLLKMHEQGARGVRVNVLFASSAKLDNIKTLCDTINSIDKGWHLQVLADISTLDNIKTFVTDLGIDVVFDHFGHTSAAKGIDTRAINGLMQLLSHNQCWIKMSGAYRISEHRHPPYSDVDALAKALVEVNSGRLVWGSDWPHPHFAGDMPNDGPLLDELARWVPDKNTRQRILVDNPALLYDF